MICDFCGNVSENKRAVSLYMRAARITYIDCPLCGCALSMSEIRAAVMEQRYNHNHDSKGRFCSGSGSGGSSAKALDKSAESGIIEKEKTMFSEEEVKPMTFSSDYNVPEGLTESASFRSKFCAMDDDPSVQNEYYQAAKEILQHRSGNDGEDLYYYNTATKKWYKSTTGTLKGTPDIYNEEIIKGLSESERGEIVAFHNHPRGMPPSDGDLNAALTKGYAKGYTIGHNGRIYEYTAPAEIIPEGMYDMFYAAFLADGHSDFDAQIMTIEKLKPVYRFSYKEIL